MTRGLERRRTLAALLALASSALVVGAYVVHHQRLELPGWVPLLGTRTFTWHADLGTAQAISPGQGQQVVVAGVPIGQVTGVALRDGHAVVTVRTDPAEPIYRDARLLVRPRTGLQDMTIEVSPGHRAAGRLPDSGTLPLSATLTTVNLDEVLSALDADTRDYLVALVQGLGHGLRHTAPVLARDLRRFAPTTRQLRRLAGALAARRLELGRLVHNLSLIVQTTGRRDAELGRLVDASSSVFGAVASRDTQLGQALRLVPGTLATTRAALDTSRALAAQLAPALDALRPGVHALPGALDPTRALFAQTRPVIHDRLRPFVAAALPALDQLTPATRDLAAQTPNLGRVFRVADAVLNGLAYNPPGPAEGYLFYFLWASHVGNTLFGVQDAHGPIRRGIVLATCSTIESLDNAAQHNAGLAIVDRLLALPRAPCNGAHPGSGG